MDLGERDSSVPGPTTAAIGLARDRANQKMREHRTRQTGAGPAHLTGCRRSDDREIRDCRERSVQPAGDIGSVGNGAEFGPHKLPPPPIDGTSCQIDRQDFLLLARQLAEELPQLVERQIALRFIRPRVDGVEHDAVVGSSRERGDVEQQHAAGRRPALRGPAAVRRGLRSGNRLGLPQQFRQILRCEVCPKMFAVLLRERMRRQATIAVRRGGQHGEAGLRTPRHEHEKDEQCDRRERDQRRQQAQHGPQQARPQRPSRGGSTPRSSPRTNAPARGGLSSTTP